MKKENKELAKEKRKKERDSRERKKMMKTIVLICLIALVIAILIIVTAIQAGTPEEGEADTSYQEETDYTADDEYKGDIDTEDTDSKDSESSEEDGLITEEGTVLEEGDTADIHFVGYIDDDYQFSGGTGDYDLTLGSGSFIEGFEEGLIGHEVGETVTLDLTFPDNYFNNTENADGETISLAGKPVKFVVTINGVYK